MSTPLRLHLIGPRSRLSRVRVGARLRGFLLASLMAVGGVAACEKTSGPQVSSTPEQRSAPPAELPADQSPSSTTASPALAGSNPEPVSPTASVSSAPADTALGTNTAITANTAPTTNTAPVADAELAVLPLRDGDGNLLPQTEERPTTEGPALQARLRLLVQAIADDSPELALPAFFPVEAYAQVKAIKDPERDWKRRLVAAFERNIHEYHARLAKSPRPLHVVRLEVPEPRVKWMKPGSEGNRVGYYRVLRSNLVVADATGKETSLELTSLISWRGEWYVVHLHGFE